MTTRYGTLDSGWLRAVAVTMLLLTAPISASAEQMPGEGIEVRPATSNVAEEMFQALIVARGLEELGYDVQPITEMQIQLAHVAAGNGDVDYYTPHWQPLHKGFWEEAGGDDKLRVMDAFVLGNSLQGYLIDKRTADQYGISNLGQLQDPNLAKLFDIDSDGKADLFGCEPGWGCERVIEHQLPAFGLGDTVTHNQGGYFAIIPEAIERIRSGQPTLYYTWTPLWLSALLRPGEEVVWLEVPFTAHPNNLTEAETSVDGIGNMGFAANTQHIIANTAFLESNPAAETWFNQVEIPLEDINAQNLKMRNGEKSEADVRGHVDAWIAANRSSWDSWLAEARAASQ